MVMVMPNTRLALPLGDTERPVPVWALRLAKALPFVVLPHCLGGCRSPSTSVWA